MSDVPVGMFLSGGLDSAALCGMVAPMLAEPLRTFAVGFDEPEANELGWARLAAAAAGTIHHEVVVSRESFVGILPRLIWHEDEPIAFSSSVPLYFLARTAADHVKVVLTGEGADEIFLGYNRYRITALNERLGRLYRHLPAAGRAGVARLAAAVPGAFGRRLARTVLARGDAPRDIALENFAVFPEALQRGLLREPALVEARDPYAAALASWEDGAGAVDALSRSDLETYLVELLMKQDQMSMAASIESRVPYLDHELVEYVVAIPARRRLHGARTKAILRDAVAGVVPPAILDRRKMGFPVPLDRWMRGALAPAVSDLLLGPRAAARGLFDTRAVGRLVAEHTQGAAAHGERLWLLVNLEIWQRLFLDREDPHAIAETLHA
jgi:asparagine synthase (glutamine-hydrolysing)